MCEIRNVLRGVRRQKQARKGVRAKVPMIRFVGTTGAWRLFWKFTQKVSILIWRKAGEDLERRDHQSLPSSVGRDVCGGGGEGGNNVGGGEGFASLQLASLGRRRNHCLR